MRPATYGLVRHRGNLAFDEDVGEGSACGQVEVREEDLLLPQQVELLRNGLLDLEDHLRLPPHLFGGVDELGACADVSLLGQVRPDGGTLLDDDPVPRGGQLPGAFGGEGDPVFVVLDLFRHTDDHGALPAEVRSA
jgi:hypothetical protein